MARRNKAAPTGRATSPKTVTVNWLDKLTECRNVRPEGWADTKACAEALGMQSDIFIRKMRSLGVIPWVGSSKHMAWDPQKVYEAIKGVSHG